MYRTAWNLAAAVVCAVAAGILAAAPSGAAMTVTAVDVTPIAWHACPADPALDCAAYPVPLNYADRAAGTVDLALYRRPATDPAHRVGTLFVNPGGPGDSAFKMTANLVATYYPGLTARFDILGMDPRGVGASTPIHCFPSDADWTQALGAFVAVPLTPAETSTDMHADGVFTHACAANAEPLLAHMSTADVARDLDTLRQALGASQLDYFGQSYGTMLGATYANLFPNRVRAMVLDAMVDPAARTGDSLAYEEQRAMGFESMLDNFLGACRHALARCAFSAGNPAEKFAVLRARIWRGPLALPDGTTMTASRFWNWLTEGIPAVGNWPGIAAYLQQVYDAATTSSAQASADRATGTAGSGADQAYSYNSSDAFSAVNCADEQLPRTPDDWAADREPVRSARSDLRARSGIQRASLRHLAGHDRPLRRPVGPSHRAHPADRGQPTRPSHPISDGGKGQPRTRPHKAAHHRRVRPHLIRREYLRDAGRHHLPHNRAATATRHGLPARHPAVH